jgi:hypothetical protein
MVNSIANYNYNNIPTHLIRKTAPVTNNVSSTTFLDKWPNGRLYKHGAMAIEFCNRPKNGYTAIRDIEGFMQTQELVRSEHYHIPAWNFPPLRTGVEIDEWISNPLIVTFATEEHFIMAKLAWDFGNDE